MFISLLYVLINNFILHLVLDRFGTGISYIFFFKLTCFVTYSRCNSMTTWSISCSSLFLMHSDRSILLTHFFSKRIIGSQGSLYWKNKLTAPDPFCRYDLMIRLERSRYLWYPVVFTSSLLIENDRKASPTLQINA